MLLGSAVAALSLLVAGPAAAAKTKLPATGIGAGFTGKAAHVYDLYYEHCRHYTWVALAYPRKARNAAQAARIFAGPTRPFQPPAFRGCLAGLGAGQATIDLERLLALIAADDEGGGAASR
jgi:hypothetical protein